jgi:acyl dehydratase
MTRTLALALALTLTFAAGAAAFTTYKMRGPKSVHTGDKVRFTASGLEPGEKVTVNLAPTSSRGGNCCGIDVLRDKRANQDGKAVLRFKWPKRYLNGGEKVAWEHREKVDVIVLGRNGRGLKVVRVKTR